MAINSLKNVIGINGCAVAQSRPKLENGEVDWENFDSFRDSYPILIDHEKDYISFKMLTKPASEGGDLGLCQFTALIETGLTILKYLDAKYPCRENAITITKLQEALMWQTQRTVDRIVRGVEGKDEN